MTGLRTDGYCSANLRNCQSPSCQLVLPDAYACAIPRYHPRGIIYYKYQSTPIAYSFIGICSFASFLCARRLDEMPTRNIIVTGATGRQGRAFTHALFNSPTATSSDVPNYHIWAVTRNPTSPAASSLLLDEQSHAQDITIVQGDLNNAARIKEIFTQVSAEGGIFGAFIVLAYPGLGNKGDEEERQGKVGAPSYQKCRRREHG